jgi:hypothetical protein
MIDFFDANHWLDSSKFYISSNLYDDDEKKAGIEIIRQKLDDNDIKNVIITSKLAYGYDWNIGNEKLLKSGIIEKIEGLYYGLVINTDTYFTYDIKKYVNDMYAKGVRLFRLFPKRQIFYINDHYLKKIYEVLSERHFPIMIDLKQLDITGNKYFDIDVLEKILSENKDMPLILETTLKQCMFSRIYFPLLEKYKNLYLEVSGLLLYDQIEHYVERFGSERLIFGTNYPDLPVEINTNRIILANIKESDKKNIAFNNINSIIGGIEIV